MSAPPPDSGIESMSDASQSTSASAATSALKSRVPSIAQSSLRLAALRAEELRLHGENALVLDPFAERLCAGMKPGAHHAFRATTTAPATVKRGRQRRQHEGEDTAGEDSAHAASTAKSSSVECIAAAAASSASDLATEEQSARLGAPDTLIRARFIDDTIRSLCSDPSHPLEQLVLLGAGMDSRSYRLACLRDTRVWELDAAPILQHKAHILQDEPLACSQLRRVQADFMETGDAVRVSRRSMREASGTDSNASNQADSALRPPPWLSSLLASDFDMCARTLWVAEGLLMYLGGGAVVNMLSWIAHEVRRSHSSSRSSSSSAPSTSAPFPSHELVFDLVNSACVQSRLKWFRLFRFGLDRTSSPTLLARGHPNPPCVSSLLRACGWELLREGKGEGEGEGRDRRQVHVIGRDTDAGEINYGRFTQPPLMDSVTRPDRPPVRLESYVARARVVPYEE